MNTLSNFKDATLMWFENGFRYLSVVFRNPDTVGQTENNFFVDKKAGAYEFGLNLGRVRGELEGIWVYFTGRITDEANRIVTWAVDLDALPRSNDPRGRAFGDYTIADIKGQLITRIDDIARPEIAPGNDADLRLYNTILTLIGTRDDNKIEVYIEGVSFAVATAYLSDGIAKCGAAVTDFRFDVRVSVNNLHEDGCGNKSLLINTPSRFMASIENLRSMGNIAAVTYKWEAIYQLPDGQIYLLAVSGEQRESYWDHTPQFPWPMRIKVTVNLSTDASERVERGMAIGELRTVGRSLDGMILANALCRFRHNIAGFHSILVRGSVTQGNLLNGGRRIIDPLWDPTPEALRGQNSFSLQQLNQLARNMERTIQYATEIQKIAGSMAKQEYETSYAEMAKMLQQAIEEEANKEKK